MRTFRRVAVIGLTAVVVLAVVGWFGLKAYLNSSAARSLAAGRLSDALGLPVTVNELSVGGSSSSLSFQVTEPTTEGQPPREVLKVESATADVSLGDLVRQSVAPKEVTLIGVTLTIRIDKDGRLLTTLPSTSGGGTGGDIPAVRIENGTLKMQQDGRPEFAVTGIHGTLLPKDGSIVIDGKSSDPNWGEWTAAGTIDPKALTGNVVLNNPAGRADMALLSSVPFVPAATWEHVRVSGTTAIKLTFTLAPEKQFGYRVELNPNGGAEVTVSDIDAVMTKVAGAVRIEAARVTLTDVKGAIADGTVTLNGDLDFNPSPSVLKLKVATAGVDVQKLPKEWGLPAQVAGKLRGAAALEIRVPASGPNEYRGGGDATLEGATIAGLPAEVKLALRSDGKRYRFQTADPDAKAPVKSRSNNVIVRPVVRNVRRQEPKPADEPTTLDASITLRDVDIAELLTRLEVKVPYKLSGKVTVKAAVSIPVAQADNSRSYKFSGTLTSPDFGLEGLRIRDLSAALKYTEGKLTLSALSGKVGDGKLSGSATANVEPPGELSAKLTLDRVALGDALKALPGATPDVRGPVSGTVEFRGPIDKLSDPATFAGTADLRADELTVYGRVIRSVQVPLKLEKGQATIAGGKASVEGIPLVADGSIGLTKPFAFTATATATAVETADFRRLVPELALPFPLAGKLDTTAKLSGTVSPLAYTATGTAKADELRVGTNGANKVSVEWAVDAERVRVPKLTADLFGGSIDGSADVPFAADKPGRFDVTFKELDAGAAAKAIPDVPVKLSGKVSGELKGTLPAAGPNQSRTPTADLDLSAPKLTVQGVPAERLTGKIGFADGAATYQLEGRTLGGTFELKGRYPSKPAAERGSLHLRGLRLRDAAAAFNNPKLAQLRGTVDANFEFDSDLSDGTGRAVVRTLAWGRTIISEQVVANLRLRDGVFELADVTGTVAGGVVRGRGRVGLPSTGRSYFQLTVDRADPKRLFAPVPAVADNLTGEVSVMFRGRLNGELTGSGSVSMDRGTVFGLPASELRIPFDWSHGVGTTEVVVRDASGRLGEGRVTGTVHYTGGAVDRLDGQLRFTEVRLGSAVAALGSVSVLRSGRVTGRFDFGATALRSADDLTGRLSAVLNQTSVQEIPILRQVSPYLSPTGITAPFQSGEIKGRLAGGVFRLERLTLANPSAQLFADGTVTLAGQLDLRVVANTGRVGVDARAATLLGLRVPLFGPIPVGLLADISAFLSNRTIRLDVTGPVSSPQVRVNTAALVSEEAVRFLLGRYVPALGTGSILNETTQK